MSDAEGYDYFTVRKGSEADKAIEAFFAQRKAANDVSFAWARKQGSRSRRLLHRDGCVSGLYFSAGRAPEGWIASGKANFWRPHSKRAGKAYRQMKKLPRIPMSEELSEALGTEMEFLIRGFRHVGCGLSWLNGRHVVSIHSEQKRPTVRGLRPVKVSTVERWREEARSKEAA